MTERQNEIARIVKEDGPITGSDIAERLHVTRAALRSDLAILTMAGILDARPKVGYYYLGYSQVNPLADQLEGYLVRNFMSQPVVIDPTTSVYDAIITMFMEDIGTLLVGEDNCLVGVISRKDLLRAVMGNNNEKEQPITMIMTPVSKIIYADGNETVLSAAERLIDFEVDCLPVVENTGEEGKHDLRIIGRLSKTNITRLFVECGQRVSPHKDV